MSPQDELRALRQELESLNLKVSQLRNRLNQIEDELHLEEEEPETPIPPPWPVPPRPPEPVIPREEVRPVQYHPTIPEMTPVKPIAPPAVSSYGDLFPSTRLDRYLHDWAENLKRKSRELGWEVLLGTYWLPRIAVVCVAIAVVFFLSLAIQRWGSQYLPHLRVGVGYVICTGLMVAAWRFEKKYRDFARVLYAGGFGVMYFVTFATHYVELARVFATPAPTLILLTIVVAGWAVAGQVRRSKVIAVLVTLLGHLTIMLSTLTLENPASFAIAGILVLSLGSAFFLLRNQWYYIAAVGIVGSYLNNALVLSKAHGNRTVSEFVMAMSVVAGIYMIFALAELFAPRELRTKKAPTWFRTGFVTANTAAFFALGSSLVRYFPFTIGHEDIFRFALAAALLLLGLAYYFLRERDPLFNVFFTKAIAIFTLGLAARYGGSTLSAWLAAETVVLLLSARFSGLVVTRVLAFAVGAVAFVQAAAIFGNMQHLAYDAPNYWPTLCNGALTVVAFFTASQIYQRTDWASRSPKGPKMSQEYLLWLWQLDLIRELPDDAGKCKKPLQGLLFPYLYAVAGGVVFTIAAYVLAQEGHLFVTYSAFAVAMMIAAALLGSIPFGLNSIAATVVPAFLSGANEMLHGRIFNPPYAIAGLCLMMVVALSSEKKYFGERAGLYFHQQLVSSCVLYGLVAGLSGLFCVEYFTTLNAVLALVVASAITAVLSFILNPNAMLCICTSFLFWAGSIYLSVLLPDYSIESLKARYVGWTVVAAAILLDRFLNWTRKALPVVPLSSAALAVLATAVLLVYLEADILPEWIFAAVAIAGCAFVAYAAAFRGPAYALAGVFCIAMTSVRVLQYAWKTQELDAALLIGFVLPVLFWIGSERVVHHFRNKLDDLYQHEFNAAAPNDLFCGVPITITALMLLLMLYRVPFLVNANSTFITIGWFALALFLLLWSLPIHQRIYRYWGLGIIALSLARVFLIDMKEQDPLLRVAAFAVVGLGLLFVSYGYFRWLARLRAQKAQGNQ